MRFAFRTAPLLENLNRATGTRMEGVEAPDTLDYFLGRLPSSELPELLHRMVQRLLRMKCLEAFRMRGHVLVAVDATGLWKFNRRHCEHCLTQQHEDRTTYYHMALEAKLVTSSGMTLSLMTEFIENETPGTDRQDCELKAFYRLARALKVAFPQLRICLLLDGLYLCEPVLKVCRSHRWAYVATFKEGRLPERWREYLRLRDLVPEARRRIDFPTGVRQDFAWVPGLDLGEERTNVLECRETALTGTETTYVWGTNFDLKEATVGTIANEGGRLRWKIENEGFNEQKNGGYRLEHAYSQNLEKAKNYYLLLQIAQLLEQLMQQGSLLRQTLRGTVPALLGGVRKLAEYLKESLRLWVIPIEAFDAASAAHIQIRLNTS